MEFHGIAPAVLFNIGPLPVTNTLFTSWVALVTLLILVRLATSRLSIVPGRMQSVAELVIEQFVAIGTQTADEKRARRFLPLAGTLFLFILVSNWMGVLPFFGEGELYIQRGQEKLNILRSANSDLSITFAMGLIVFLYSEYAGFKAGGLAYAREFIWPGMLIEVISHLARPVALALRLFGNILAGEILLGVMATLVPFLVPALFMGFELFVGIVQALIFSLLTVAFLAMATAHESAHHEAGHESAAHH